MKNMTLAIELSMDKNPNEIITLVQHFNSSNKLAEFYEDCISTAALFSEKTSLEIMLRLDFTKDARVNYEVYSDHIHNIFDLRRSSGSNIIHKDCCHNYPTSLFLATEVGNPRTDHYIGHWDSFSLIVSDAGKKFEFVMWHSAELGIEYRSGEYSLSDLVDNLEYLKYLEPESSISFN